jgi:tetratricopeptide (TPR) repeat protein
MTYIDEKRAKGNYGVFLVASKLSKFCLVRPVSEGTDQGIDLFCESFEDAFRGGRPFLHFWVQVKTLKGIQKNSNFASFSFDVNHLNYWGRQPVPVFAFLVPIESLDSEEPFRFYVIDFTRQILENNSNSNQKNCTLYSSLLIQNDDDIKRFISKLVLSNSALLKIREGVIAHMPSLDPSYVISFPPNQPIRYIDVILQQIRRTSAMAIQGMLQAREDESPELAQKRRKLTEVLQCFENNDHYENQYSLGLSKMKDKDYSKAKDHFEKSLKIINRDPEIDQKRWEGIKERLRKLITQCGDNDK